MYNVIHQPLLWKTICAFFIPKAMTVQLYSPSGVTKNDIPLAFSDKGICLKPFTKSQFVTYLACHSCQGFYFVLSLFQVFAKWLHHMLCRICTWTHSHGPTSCTVLFPSAIPLLQWSKHRFLYNLSCSKRQQVGSFSICHNHHLSLVSTPVKRIFLLSCKLDMSLTTLFY